MSEHIHGEGYCQACIEFAATEGAKDVMEEAVRLGAERASEAWEARLPQMLQDSYNAGYAQARADADAARLAAQRPTPASTEESK